MGWDKKAIATEVQDKLNQIFGWKCEGGTSIGTEVPPRAEPVVDFFHDLEVRSDNQSMNLTQSTRLVVDVVHLHRGNKIGPFAISLDAQESTIAHLQFGL